MTMHIVGPWLSTTGKKKVKRKFRSAANAAKSRELQESWQELLKRHDAKPTPKRKKKNIASPKLKPQPVSHRGTDQPRIPSLPFTGGVCAKGQDKIYTGNNILGIGTLHKSNAVPIFTNEEARDIAHMRR